jgi:hypothetical protein
MIGSHPCAIKKHSSAMRATSMRANTATSARSRRFILGRRSGVTR